MQILGLPSHVQNTVKKKKKIKETIMCQCSLWNPQVAIQFWPTSVLDLMHALASDALEDIGGALFYYHLELGRTLDEQESSKPKCIDAQLLAQHCEHMRALLSQEDIHVTQHEQHII